MPSIQIGALKAFLRSQGIDASCDHFYLRVAHWLGLATYGQVWAPNLDDGEALYGALLYPGQRSRVLSSPSFANKKLVIEKHGASIAVPSVAFFELFARMHEEALDGFDFRKIHLVGFTLNFAQTLSSAYLAALIKKRAPHVKVVIGGAEATGELGDSLLREFPQFDFACSGEGELAILSLARHLESRGTLEYSKSIRSLRGAGGLQTPQVSSIDELPVPDFDDYFRLVDQLGHEPQEICDYLPFETSRGCYYACSFCSLNVQWDGYRQQTQAGISQKISTLRRKHSKLDFFFVDNITPIGVGDIARELSAHRVDYRFFYEARVNLDRETWRALADAGLKRVQLGIEALSDGLLALYNKKASVIHNLQALKNCCEFGIQVAANIILDHPSSRQEHVDESLEVFEYAKAFPPALSFSHYALMVGSPDYKLGLPGVRVVGNYTSYRRAFPDEALERLNLPRKQFECDQACADFQPLVSAIEGWEQQFARLRAGGLAKAPLSMRDGGDFLLLTDFRGGDKITYQLDADERAVYLAISQIQRVVDVAKVTHLDRSWVEGAMQHFHKEKIAFFKRGRALALAVNTRA